MSFKNKYFKQRNFVSSNWPKSLISFLKRMIGCTSKSSSCWRFDENNSKYRNWRIRCFVHQNKKKMFTFPSCLITSLAKEIFLIRFSDDVILCLIIKTRSTRLKQELVFTFDAQRKKEARIDYLISRACEEKNTSQCSDEMNY